MPEIFVNPKQQLAHTQHQEHPVALHAMKKPETYERDPDKKTPEEPATKIEKRFARLHRINLLSSFVRDPLGIKLSEQHADEHVLLFSRRSMITNIPWMIIACLLLFLPFFFPLIFQPLNLPPSIFSFFTNTILILFYYILICGYAFINFATWFYDIDIVTEKRAVDIDFYNISFISVATARVHDLKDVRFTQKGFLASLANYGDVTLAVEASGEILIFESMPHPAEVVSMLSVMIGGHKE